MRQFAYDLESELANLGIACTIIVKTDRELPFGGRYELQTERGPFTYRYYRIDPVKDEDLVYIFVLYKGASTYRFRLSLTGTLASMLRARNKIDEDRILEVYLDRIKALLASEVTPEKVYDVMFSSKDLRLFAGD